MIDVDDQPFKIIAPDAVYGTPGHDTQPFKIIAPDAVYGTPGHDTPSSEPPEGAQDYENAIASGQLDKYSNLVGGQALPSEPPAVLPDAQPPEPEEEGPPQTAAPAQTQDPVQTQAPVSETAPQPAPATGTSSTAPVPPIGQPAGAVQQALSTEDAAWTQDLRDAKVTPQTYQSMFANQDTLGKAGMLFGMFMGGLGSGGNPQNNVFLNMMDKNIQRDIDAQKTNISNQQSLYSLVGQNELRKAQETLANTNSQFTQAQIPNEKLRGQYMQAQTSYMNSQNQVMQYALTYQKAQRAQAQQIYNNIKKIPTTIKGPGGPVPNPQYQQAMLGYNSFVNYIGGQIAGVQGAAEAKMGLYKAMNNIPDASDPNAGEKALQNMAAASGDPDAMRIASYRQSQTLPANGPGDTPDIAVRPIDPQDRRQLGANQALLSAANQLMQFSSQNGGNWTPQTINQGAGLYTNMRNAFNAASPGASYYMNPEEQSMMQRVAGLFQSNDPTALVQDKTFLPKIKAAVQGILNSDTALRRSYGLRVNPGAAAARPAGASTPTPGPSQTWTIGKKQYSLKPGSTWKPGQQ